MAAAFPDIFNTPGFDTPGAFNTDGRITSGQRAPPPPKLTNTTRPGWMVWTQLFDAYLSMYNTEAHDALTNGLANVWARKALYVLFIQAVAEADQSLFLEKEIARHHETGAWEHAPEGHRTHICRVHLVPKKVPPGEPPKWRIVVDLRPTNA